jgi:hypothetical protein
LASQTEWADRDQSEQIESARKEMRPSGESNPDLDTENTEANQRTQRPEKAGFKSGFYLS